MSKIAIKVENLSKAYQLGNIGTGTISRDIERWWAKMRGKEDPFLRIGEKNDRALKGSNNVVYSLKDINFEIEQGDSVGIIGRNGAGKSTLLKILSKVTAPTTGKISGNGRVASLLEVGTGFHPELTGRENIYLNGAMLGMRKHEIDKKFDEIVDFSGVDRYIDTPVKRYSSGMYVRLAFAVAAHLESEILIVDEVLAVGDVEFQSKSIGKMNQIQSEQGRTVLFVSHNMEIINRLCKKTIWLNNGNMIEYGSTNVVIDSYKKKIKEDTFIDIEDLKSNRIIIHSCELKNKDALFNGDVMEFKISITHLVEESIDDNFIFEFYREGMLSFISTTFHINTFQKNSKVLLFKTPKYLFNPGFYSMNLKVVDKTGNYFEYLYLKDVITFEVIDDGIRRGAYKLGWDGPVSPLFDFIYE